MSSFTASANMNRCKRQAKLCEYLKYQTFCIQGRPKPRHVTQMQKYGMVGNPIRPGNGVGLFSKEKNGKVNKKGKISKKKESNEQTIYIVLKPKMCLLSRVH